MEVDDVAAPKLFNTLAEWAAPYMEVSEKVPVKVSEVYEGAGGVGSKRKIVPKGGPDSSEVQLYSDPVIFVQLGRKQVHRQFSSFLPRLQMTAEGLL